MLNIVVLCYFTPIALKLMDLTGYPPHIFDVKRFVNLTETAFSKQLCQLISIFKQWPGVVI